MGLTASLSFDASVKQWIHPGQGRTVYVAGEEQRRYPVGWSVEVARQGVQVRDATPGWLRALRSAGGVAVGTVLVGGQSIDEELWSWLGECQGHWNVYGPSECTVDATAVEIVGLEPRLGRVLGNVQVWVMGEDWEPAPVGVEGELWIGGAGVGRGYCGDAGSTAERFVAGESGGRLYRSGDRGRYREDGTIAYAGRRDGQVKVRGHRIELAEIEGELQRHPGVKEAVADVRGESIWCWVVSGWGKFGGVVRRLSGGLEIEEQNRYESDALWEEIFERQVYGRHGIRLGAGSCVWDVGANIGLFTLWVSRHVAGVRVYAFEPLAENYAKLVRNCGRNQVQAELRELGLGGRTGWEEYRYYGGYTSLSGALRHGDEGGDREWVRRWMEGTEWGEWEGEVSGVVEGRLGWERRWCREERLSEALRRSGEQRIDLLKVDVQGGEWELLEGIVEEDWGRIEQIVVEAHEREGRVAALRDLLQGHGFGVLVEQEGMSVGTDRWMVYGRRGGVTAGSERWEEAGGSEALEWSEAGVRRWLGERLPEPVVPSRVMRVERIPLTDRGKVDRSALPEPAEEGKRGERCRTVEEELVAGAYGAVLGREEVGREGNFFELGGHSLRATQLVARLREGFGVELPLRSVFESPEVWRLAERIVELRRSGEVLEAAPPLVARGQRARMALSFSQQRLWFLEQMSPGTGILHCAQSIRLEGTLHIGAVERALTEILRRHEVLRTNFVVEDGRPVAHVASTLRLAFPQVDLGDLPPAAREREARALATAFPRAAFDLAYGPLVRTEILRLAPDDHILLIAMHHIVTDGWSMGILVREFAALYQAYASNLPSPLPELSIQYSDYAAWQHEYLQPDRLDGLFEYWRHQLADVEPLELPVDRPRPLHGVHRGGRISFDLPLELSRRIRAFSRREGSTLFMTVLAAWQILLGRYARQTAVTVGAPIANRNRLETEGIVGFFINMLVLRADVRGDLSFAEFLARTRQVVLDAYAHQDAPFERIVQEFGERGASRAPLFQTVIVFQNAPGESLALPGLRVTAVETGLERYAVRTDAADVGSRRAARRASGILERPVRSGHHRWHDCCAADGAGAGYRRAGPAHRGNLARECCRI